MKIIHLNGFSEEERLSYKSIIYSNTFMSMRTLCQACADSGVSVAAECEEAFHRIMDNDDVLNGGDLTPQLANDLKLLWKDKEIREAYSRSNEFQLLDSAA